jgi:branched-chain amino acid transport system permease protein
LSAHGLDSWNAVILGGILALLVVAAPAGLYARLRARPVTAGVAFVVVTGVLAIINVWGETLDWIVCGMLAAAVAAIALGTKRSPGEKSGGQTAPALVEDTESVSGAGPVTAGPAAAAPVAAGPAAAAPVAAGPAGEEDADRGPVLVEIRELAKHFGGVHALDDITLDVRAGELIGLVGPNGSGKTTLVDLLSGRQRPTRGAIRVGGTDLGRLAPHEIAHVGIARTYQIPKPFGSMTVRDNVATAIMFGRRPVSLREARPLAERHLATVALGHLADAHPGHLNLHQRQLLEMARAIAAGPRVLLLDEALAGLNPAEVDNAVEVVRRIHAGGITIVIVEHLLRVLNQLATRLVVLDRGTVLADGAPAAVMSDPAVIRAYLGRQAHV